MITKLVRHNGELALIIDDQMVKQLKIDEHTPLEVVVREHALVVSPANNPVTDAEFERILEEINQRYEKAFRRLAE